MVAGALSIVKLARGYRECIGEAAGVQGRTPDKVLFETRRGRDPYSY